LPPRRKPCLGAKPPLARGVLAARPPVPPPRPAGAGGRPVSGHAAWRSRPPRMAPHACASGGDVGPDAPPRRAAAGMGFGGGQGARMPPMPPPPRGMKRGAIGGGGRRTCAQAAHSRGRKGGVLAAPQSPLAAHGQCPGATPPAACTAAGGTLAPCPLPMPTNRTGRATPAPWTAGQLSKPGYRNS